MKAYTVTSHQSPVTSEAVFSDQLLVSKQIQPEYARCTNISIHFFTFNYSLLTEDSQLVTVKAAL